VLIDGRVYPLAHERCVNEFHFLREVLLPKACSWRSSDSRPKALNSLYLKTIGRSGLVREWGELRTLLFAAMVAPTGYARWLIREGVCAQCHDDIL
jgi:hypothetical protein